MHLERLRGRKIVDRVLRDGYVRKGRHMWLRWLPGPPRHPAVDRTKAAIYVGTLVSSKQEKSAVKRNRMRRRCREALRLLLKDMESEQPVAKSGSSLQLLILPRSSSLRASFPDLQNDLRSFLSTLPPWPPKLQQNAPRSSSLR